MLLADQLAELVAPAGTIVLSGILEEQAMGLMESYGRWFDMEQPTVRQGWVRLVGQRNG